jgi:hypothetical protein
MRLMDVTPTTSTKRPGTKVAAKDPAAKAPRKILKTTRKKSTEANAVSAETPARSADLHGMIETAAFYLAAERSFAPGHELDDWLEAERRIRALYSP